MLTVISTNVASQFVEYCVIVKFLLLLLYGPTYRILDFFGCSFLPLQWSAMMMMMMIIIIIIIIITGVRKWFFLFRYFITQRYYGLPL